MSFYNIEEVYFDSYYIKNTKENLEKLKNYLEDIKKEFNLIKDKINDNFFTFPSKLYQNFENQIKKYQEWFENIDKSDKQKYLNELKKNSKNLKEPFNKFYEKIASTYNLTFFKNVPQFNDSIKNIMDNLGEYEPINENQTFLHIDSKFEDNINSQYYSDSNNLYKNIYGDEEDDYYENPNKNEGTLLKCHIDGDKEAVYYCPHCDFLFCEKCKQRKISSLIHNFIKISEKILENENQKNIFLKSFMNLFKDYLLKCDFIIKYINIDNTNKIIKQKFVYPKINNIDFKSQIESLKNINDFYKENVIEKIETESNDLADLSNFMKNTLRAQLSLGSLELAENEDSFSDENYVKGDYDKIRNQFYYIIDLIKKGNYNSVDKNFNKETVELISKALNIKEENIKILPNNKRAFINYFIKTELFWKLSPKKIKNDYPDLTILYEYKILIDGLICYKCKISKEKLDYKYNFITPNLSLNNRRGKEIYLPPYGWFGIGLNVINKYDKGNNDWLNVQDKSGKWAICYYFFDKNLSSDEIMVKLNKVIMNNELFLDKSQIKMNEYNTRAKLKRIGTGYYLSYDINIAEKYTGIIYFGNKKFKILLMAKVLIESIKEPADKMFWIISKKEHIRIYRILLKEINN